MNRHLSQLSTTFGTVSSRVDSSLFDGDPEPLERAILDPDVEEFVCNALFEGLAFLTADGRIPLERTREFIARCHRELPRDEDSGMRWAGWQKAISYLALTDHVPLVREAFQRNDIDPMHMDIHDFESDLAAALAARKHGELPPDPHLGYFQDVTAEFSGWYGFSLEWVREQLRRQKQKVMNGDFIEPWDPYINPLRHVGRNDPCPCGSGRKYKKCCQAS